MLVLAQLSPWLMQLFVVGFLAVCVLMVLTVLIQRPQGGGLSGAFGAGSGGGSAGQTAFGARTGDALTIATIAIFVIYLLAAIGLVFTARTFATTPMNQTPIVEAVPGTDETGAIDDTIDDLAETGREAIDDTAAGVDEAIDEAGAAIDDAAEGAGDLIDDAQGAIDDAAAELGDETPPAEPTEPADPSGDDG